FFEVIVIAEDIAGIEEGNAAYAWKIVAGRPYCMGSMNSTRTSLIALDAFVAGKAQEGDAVGRHWRDGLVEVEELDYLVPALLIFFVSIVASGPALWLRCLVVVRIDLHMRFPFFHPACG